ncbi:MAG: hypothetical protein Q9224_007494, partial [Gallowayella concinna]
MSKHGERQASSGAKDPKHGEQKGPEGFEREGGERRQQEWHGDFLGNHGASKGIFGPKAEAGVRAENQAMDGTAVLTQQVTEGMVDRLTQNRKLQVSEGEVERPNNVPDVHQDDINQEISHDITQMKAEGNQATHDRGGVIDSESIRVDEEAHAESVRKSFLEVSELESGIEEHSIPGKPIGVKPIISTTRKESEYRFVYVMPKKALT